MIGGFIQVGGFRSVADVVDPDPLLKVREFKQGKKAAVKAAGSAQ